MPVHMENETREKNQKYYFHVIDQKFPLKDPTSEEVGLSSKIHFQRHI